MSAWRRGISGSDPTVARPHWSDSSACVCIIALNYVERRRRG